MDQIKHDVKRNGIDCCLLCDTKPTKQRPLKRGLCSLHFLRHNRVEKRLKGAELKKYESLAISRGLLLPKKNPGKAVDNDVFADLAKEVQLINELPESVTKQAEKAVKKLDEHAAKTKKPKKAKDSP